MPKARKSPKSDTRKGISLVEVARRFGNDESAQEWLVSKRWKDGVTCPYCGSDRIGERKMRRSLRQWRCNDRKACGRAFTVKTGTIMHASNIPLSKWCLGFYLYSVNLKGVSSRKLRRELGLTQKNAWHMAHRIRKAMESENDPFLGPVEVDEVYIGGKEGNKHEWQKLNKGRGAVGKAPVVALKDRATGKVVALVIERTDQPTLVGFVKQHTAPDASVYTDEWLGYNRMPRSHKVVRHSAKEFVRGEVHTNGIEAWFSMLKRGYIGVYHNFSVKHLQRYVAEFSARHNHRPLDTEDQMEAILLGGIGKRLRYEDLIAPSHTRQPELF